MKSTAGRAGWPAGSWRAVRAESQHSFEDLDFPALRRNRTFVPGGLRGREMPLTAPRARM